MILDQRAEVLLRLVRAVERIEIGRHLDCGVAMQRRIRRNALVGLDRQFRLLERFIEIGEREQRQRMVGLERERQLQIDQAEILAAAAAERGAEAVERFGGAGLRIRYQRRQFLAGLELVHRLDHQRMARQRLVEGLENAERFLARSVARQPAAIGLDHAQRGGIELVGMLEALSRFLLIAGEVVDHAGMQFLEDRVPIRSGQPVDRRHRALGVAAPPACDQAESKVAVRSVIGPRIDCASSRRAAPYCLCLSACTPSTSSATRSFLSACTMRSAYFTDLSISPPTTNDRKVAVEQVAVPRIVLERNPVIGGGRGWRRAAGRHGGRRDNSPRPSSPKGPAWSAPGRKARSARPPGIRRARCLERTGRGSKTSRACSNGADDRGFYANRRGWAENGLFAPPPQERQPRRSTAQIESPDVAASWPEFRPVITYSDNSVRRRLRAEPK